MLLLSSSGVHLRKKAEAFKPSCIYSLVVCVSKTMGNVLLLTSDVLFFSAYSRFSVFELCYLHFRQKIYKIACFKIYCNVFQMKRCRKLWMLSVTRVAQYWNWERSSCMNNWRWISRQLIGLYILIVLIIITFPT